MQQKTPKFHPSAPLEDNEWEQKLESKLNDVKCLLNSIINIKELITYLKDKSHKSN